VVTTMPLSLKDRSTVRSPTFMAVEVFRV
jgi:tRNA A37 threonylcarbamoyladenosine biosynthesis protein TsaE